MFFLTMNICAAESSSLFLGQCSAVKTTKRDNEIAATDWVSLIRGTDVDVVVVESFLHQTSNFQLQPADIGWPTGNGKKLSCSQAQLGQATCLSVA